ncbi:MAG TPA: phospho-sugar mutase [Polyangiaceae bacterium]|nr:phospho-sugar mutase [Polyangiaceae bacterium]
MSGTLSEDLLSRARAWQSADPDPETRAELEALIASGDRAELSERLGAELDFGTAGLRGAVGAGPARMNRAVVVRASRALAEHLLVRVPDARALSIVVGYDARPNSRALAEAAAGVLLAAGISVRWFDAATPTPLVAYASRVFSAAAALVVTASHNPRGDNGLKIYDQHASQMGPPADADVALRRDALGPANEIPCVDALATRQGALGATLTSLGPDLFRRYLAELDAALPARLSSPRLRIAYTPLHGVGREAFEAALALRGFSDLHVVPSQAEPDGSFPTVEFPNPEVAGTLDALLALATEVHADLAIANDPDADRLAAAVREPSGRFVALTGNEIGALLADFVLGQASKSPQPLLVTSIVSSPLLGSVAEKLGARFERTLTGFKWIWRAGRVLEGQGGTRFVFGCEEALGYSIGPLVRDKDGIAAGVWLAELAERLRREGKTLRERLFEIYREHGAWGSAQRSLTRPGSSGAAAITSMIERLAGNPPAELAGQVRQGFVDYRFGAEQRAPWLGASALFELTFAGGARVLVRPSGTEPKLKVYADAIRPLEPSETPLSAATRAKAEAEVLAEQLALWLERE